MHRTKVCERCQQALPATTKYFADHLRAPDRLKPHCRACGRIIAAEKRRLHNERSKAWYHANKEKAREVAQRSYEMHRAERLAYYRRWRKENKEKVAQYQREYAERKRQETGTAHSS